VAALLAVLVEAQLQCCALEVANLSGHR
jgi:hypothetical protein